MLLQILDIDSILCKALVARTSANWLTSLTLHLHSFVDLISQLAETSEVDMFD